MYVTNSYVLEGQPLRTTVCAGGWALGQASYYSRTVPSYEVSVPAIFKWSNAAGWVWEHTYSHDRTRRKRKSTQPTYLLSLGEEKRA